MALLEGLSAETLFPVTKQQQQQKHGSTVLVWKVASEQPKRFPEHTFIYQSILDSNCPTAKVRMKLGQATEQQTQA